MAENVRVSNLGTIVLPDEVWAELRSLINPQGHFFGEFTIVINDGRITHTQKVSKVRTVMVSHK